MTPANDDGVEYVTVQCDFSLSELLTALHDRGAVVECGIIDTDAGTFTPTNDL